MILVIDFTSDEFMGRTYYFNSFSEGMAQYEEENGRLYFNGTDKKDCIKSAYNYLRLVDSDVNRYKLTQVIDQLKKEYYDENE